MTQANNVIKFPLLSPNPKVMDNEQLGEFMDENKKAFIDEIVDHYATQLINKIGIHGFPIFEDSFIDRYSFTIECLRSTVYGTLNMPHPLQSHIDKVYEVLTNEEIGRMNFVSETDEEDIDF